MKKPATQTTGMLKPKGERKMMGMRVTQGQNGGHVVHHEYDAQPHSEQFIFGEGEGKELIHHMSKHLNIKAVGKKMSPESPVEANAASVHEAKKSEE